MNIIQEKNTIKINKTKFNDNKLQNVSPLRYPGGKTRACKIIDNIICEHFNLQNYDTLVSPFFGGGSFEFYFQNKYGYKLCVNDKFTPLYNFWKQVKINKYELCNKLRIIPNISKEDFLKYRKTILELDGNILQQSIQYFIINRCSFSGATLSGGFSTEASTKRYTSSSIDKIETLDFNNIELHNFDFEQFINANTTDKSLIFLDPPYYLNKKSNLYGNNGDMHENFDHQKLFDVIKTKKNWIITYNNCEYIKNMYKNYTILDVKWSYGMNKSKNSSEIIIISK
jgi:DNA adenine methylase